ncbi:hypothetical protein HYQ46_006854 [Verticillium longisporum]|nr:hypothetical protein HYQ46_006854 [Verticillium longisporum]
MIVAGDILLFVCIICLAQDLANLDTTPWENPAEDARLESLALDRCESRKQARRGYEIAAQPVAIRVSSIIYNSSPISSGRSAGHCAANGYVATANAIRSSGCQGICDI